ncbi:MAG: hypothetical protein KC619_26570 [Myxococcales bacterium]|nr:hypothetical protein [Myxococcales bacterium]
MPKTVEEELAAEKERTNALGARVAALEALLRARAPRDHAKFMSPLIATLGIIVTATLGYGQHQLGVAQEQLTRSQAALAERHETEATQDRARVERREQTRLFAQFVEWLTGEDDARRDYAIRTVQEFLPDHYRLLLSDLGPSPRLDRDDVLAVSQALGEETTLDAASVAPDLEAFWSTNRTVRVRAYRGLVGEHIASEAAVEAVCEQGVVRTSLATYDSAWNGLRFLEQADDAAIRPHVTVCRRFADTVETRVRPATRGQLLLQNVRARLSAVEVQGT